MRSQLGAADDVDELEMTSAVFDDDRSVAAFAGLPLHVDYLDDPALPS